MKKIVMMPVNGTAKHKNVNVQHLFTRNQMESASFVQEIQNLTKNNKNVFVYLDISKGDQYVEGQEFVDDDKN